ncbi:PEP-CTERM motif protein [Opitutaceae bacterium TAV1]|nr:PEP-CTERM motif protein [Opitutaceae bacterium TAV1]
MKNKLHTLRASLALLPVAMAAGLFTCAAVADTWYLQASQGSTGNPNWNTLTYSDGAEGTLPYWKSSDGTVALGSFSKDDVFDLNGKTLRTHRDSFKGGSLRISAGTLDLKSSQGQTITGDLIVTGAGTINQGLGAGPGSATVLTINGALQLDPAGILSFAGPRDGASYVTVDANVLTGSGGMTVGSGNAARNLRLTLISENASAYTGNIRVRTGSTLVFTDTFVSGAGVQLDTGSFFTLDGDVTLASLSIGGTALQTGKKYAFAELDADFAGYFTAGGTGSIIIGTLIPEPATATLLLGAGLGLAGAARARCRRGRI